MEEKKTPLTAKITIVVLAISCILLAAALAILYLSTRLDKNKSVAAIAQLETNLDEKQSIIDNETISIETFKNHAQQYGASIPFLQSFFDDVIVYKNKQGIVYQPIDDSLPKNTYDFSKLTYKNSPIQYDDNSGVVGLKGIDVSKYQKSINWQAVKEDGVSYAFIRAMDTATGASVTPVPQSPKKGHAKACPFFYAYYPRANGLTCRTSR